MKILITGIAGFIGSNLADYLLNKGHVVIGIDNLSYGVFEQIPENVEFHKLDIRDQGIFSLFKKVDLVFHLAAKNCLNDCQADPVDTADINVRGTVNVFAAAAHASVKKVIYAESSAIYEGCTIFPTPESEMRPESFYAASKVCDHYFAESYKKFSHMKFTGLRYFCVYGPRQDYRRTIPPVMSAFIIKLLRKERPVIYGTGNKKRDFVHVDDVNRFHDLCLNDSRTDNQIYNIGSGKSFSIMEIYKMVATKLGAGIEPQFKPDLPGEAEQTLADISSAVKIGWTPRVDISAGLDTMIGWIRNNFPKNK